MFLHLSQCGLFLVAFLLWPPNSRWSPSWFQVVKVGSLEKIRPMQLIPEQNFLAFWSLSARSNAWVNITWNSEDLEEYWWIFFSLTWALTTLTRRRRRVRNCCHSYFFLFDPYKVHCFQDNWVGGRKIFKTGIKKPAVWSWKARRLPEHPRSSFLKCKMKIHMPVT